jgi:hypothetical protein
MKGAINLDLQIGSDSANLVGKATNALNANRNVLVKQERLQNTFNAESIKKEVVEEKGTNALSPQFTSSIPASIQEVRRSSIWPTRVRLYYPAQPGFSYILLSNANGEPDDNFIFKVGASSGNLETLGSVDFSGDQQQVYIFRGPDLLPGVFEQSRAYQAIRQSFAQGTLLPDRYDLRDGGQMKFTASTKADYTIYMQNVQNNNNGNYGWLITGFTDSPSFWTTEWYGSSEDNILIRHVRWGVTNNYKKNLYVEDKYKEGRYPSSYKTELFTGKVPQEGEEIMINGPSVTVTSNAP